MWTVTATRRYLTRQSIRYSIRRPRKTASGWPSKSQRDRIKNIETLIEDLEGEKGAPKSKIIAQANEIGMEPEKAEDEIEKLRRKGEIYEPSEDHFRRTD